MEPDRHCLDALDRMLERRRDSADGSSAPKGGHSCPECEGLDRVIDELRELPTACGQPGDDALAKAICERTGPLSPAPSPAGSLTPLLVGAVLLGAGLIGTLVWQSRSPQSSPASPLSRGIAIATEASPLAATASAPIDRPENIGSASGAEIGIIDPDAPTGGR